MSGARGARVVLGTSAGTHKVVAVGVAVLLSSIFYSFGYLPHYSSAAAVARDRADAAVDAQIERERPKGSMRSNLARQAEHK
jgi:hypothetical protein